MAAAVRRGVTRCLSQSMATGTSTALPSASSTQPTWAGASTAPRRRNKPPLLPAPTTAAAQHANERGNRAAASAHEEAPTAKLQSAARAAYSRYYAGDDIADDTPVWAGSVAVWVGTMNVVSEHKLPYSVGKFRFENFVVEPVPVFKTTFGAVRNLPGLTVIHPWMYQFKFLKNTQYY